MPGGESSFPHARQKGVKIYSETEIKKSKGYDRYRLPFVNELSDKLAQDGLTKTEIAGVVDFEWRLRKCQLILSNHRDQTSPSVLKNMDRMEKAYGKVKQSAAVVEKARQDKKHILADNIEKQELIPYMSELRKSQDAVMKAVNRSEKVKKQDSSDSDVGDEMSEEEIEEIVKQIKRRKDVYEFN